MTDQIRTTEPTQPAVPGATPVTPGVAAAATDAMQAVKANPAVAAALAVKPTLTPQAFAIEVFEKGWQHVFCASCEMRNEVVVLKMFDDVLEAEVEEKLAMDDVSELPEVIAVKTIMKQVDWKRACGCTELLDAPLDHICLFHDPLVLEALIVMSHGQVLIDREFWVARDPEALTRFAISDFLRMLENGWLPMAIFEQAAPEQVRRDLNVIEYIRTHLHTYEAAGAEEHLAAQRILGIATPPSRNA